MTNCPPDLFTDLDSVELPRLEPAAGPQDLVAALDYAGCAVVDSLASAGVVSAVLSQLEPHMEATATGQDDVSGHLTRRTGAVPARAPASWELLRHPLVLPVAEHYLAPPGQRFHIC